jgi:hypothetical protein
MAGSAKQLSPSSAGSYEELRIEFNKLVAEVDALILLYNAHTHRYDPTQAAVRNTSIAQTTAATDASTAASVAPALVTGTVKN